MWKGAVVFLFVISTVLSGCGFGNTRSSAVDQGPAASGSSAMDEQASQIVSRMSDSQKIGQLMMIGIMDTNVDQSVSDMLSEYHFGNVILFDRNMQNPQQVTNLTADLRQKITADNGVIPFIALDQEGGQVLRMREHFPQVPGEQALGRQDPAETKRWAVRTGTELRKMGINVNFAPVVDLGSSKGRSYSDDPDQVITYAEQACSGYADAGVWCALKHFPGIGKVKTDPHIDADIVNAGSEQLSAEDMKPFRELIQRLNNDDTFIMVSNVMFSALDDRYPACISERVMTDILRDQYGYKGLILSDDMEMGAMAKHYPFSKMGVMAVKAGADIVLVCHEYGHEQEVYNGLLHAYRDGELSKQMVDEKVIRIVRTKLSHDPI